MGNSSGDENGVEQPADSQRTMKIGRVDEKCYGHEQMRVEKEPETLSQGTNVSS